jgi:hypothetical protein
VTDARTREGLLLEPAQLAQLRALADGVVDGSAAHGTALGQVFLASGGGRDKGERDHQDHEPLRHDGRS